MKLKLLTNEQQESHKKVKICYTCGEMFEDKYPEDKKYYKVRDHCHYAAEYTRAAHSIYKIAVLFQSGSNYDYYSIITEIAEEFEVQFICLRENNEKYITFSIPIKKEV